MSFYLCAIILYDLKNVPKHVKEPSEKLTNSFYVGYKSLRLASAKNKLKLNTFISKTVELMVLGKYELRVYTRNFISDTTSEIVNFLDLKWDTHQNELCFNKNLSMMLA